MKFIHLAELGQLARDLAGLVRLGYPVVEAVQKVAPGQSPALSRVLDSSVVELQKGQTLAGSLNGQPSVMPLFVRMVDSAEKSEALADGLERAATVMDDLVERRRRCLLATLYPALVTTIVTVLLWLVCVAGGNLLSSLFSHSNLTLPLPTRVLLFFCSVGQSPLGVLLFLAPLVLLWVVVLGRAGWGLSIYRIPLLGTWLLRQEAVIYLTTVGHLCELGTPLVDATRLAIDTCSGPLQTRLSPVPSRLESGDRLSAALAPAGVIPELGLWAIERREETESLRLLEIGEVLDRELDLTMDRGLVLFEPLVFMGLLFFVGFFILSVFLPLYQLIGNLG